MSVALLSVGIDKYNDNTAGLVDSVRLLEPSVEMVIIDNAADPAYAPQPYIHRLNIRVSYAEALNVAAGMCKADWMVMVNNDVICNAPFADLVDGLDKRTVYGKVEYSEFGAKWLDGWIMVVSRQLWDVVGGFDTNFAYAGFEDADYCLRAKSLGNCVKTIDLPFTHKQAHTRYLMPDYFEQRKKNIEYLVMKHRL
jgi:hypothetical protein